MIKMIKRQKEWLLLTICIFLFAASLTGCGKKEDAEPEPKAETEISTERDDGKNKREDVGQQNKDNFPKRLSEEELAALKYVEKIEIEDGFYGETAYAYAPVGTEIYGEGFCFYDKHGLNYGVEAWAMNDQMTIEELLQTSVDIDMEYGWEYTFGSGSSDYEDIQISEIMENGNDRYVIATSQIPNMDETAFSECKKIYYLEIQNDSIAVIWKLEMTEWDTDEETDLIIDDMEKCYGIDLDPIRSTGRYFAQQEEYLQQMQDEYVPEEGHCVLAKINGYQYLGLGTLEDYDGEAECPVMIPMGSHVWFEDPTYVTSSLHGIQTRARITSLYGKDFNTEIPKYILDKQSYYKGNDDTRNVVVSDGLPLADYDAALYMTVEFDRVYTDETQHRVMVFAYILIQEDYFLEYEIELHTDQFDNSTDTILKELEDAYGFDLSNYYYKRKK